MYQIAAVQYQAFANAQNCEIHTAKYTIGV